MKVIRVSAIVMAMLTTVSFAGKNVEIPQSPPIPITVTKCGGAYTGGQLLYVAGKEKLWNGHSATVKPSGAMAGLFVGYDFCLNNGLMAALEASANLGKVEKKTKLPEAMFANNYTLLDYKKLFNVKITQNWEASIVAHLGKKLGSNQLYLLSGVTATELKVKGKTYSVKKSLYGWTAGAGYEIKIDKNWASRVEYRYNKYVAKKYGYHYMKYNSNSVSAGLKYSF